MNFRKILSYLLIILVGLMAVEAPVYGATAKKKATTTKTTTKKSTKSSKSKKSTSSKKKKSTSTKKKSTSKSTTKSTGKKKTTRKKKGTTTKKKSTARKKKTTKRRTSTPAPPEQIYYDSLTLRVNSAVLESIPQDVNPGGLRVNRVTTNGSKATVALNENFTYLPVTKDFIASLEKTVAAALPDSLQNLQIELNVGKRGLAYFISRIDKLPESARHNTPVVKEAHPLTQAEKGMGGDIVALWSSHGRYFKNGGWAWQRGFLFETLEDVFTMGYVLPYLAPMLENAGANVFMPRERDLNSEEVIVDFDTNPEGNLYSQTTYKEKNGSKKWETGEYDGFIYDLKNFRDTENPFEGGSYRQVDAVKGGNHSEAAWHADIPKDGEYAVYVSYKSLPNSVPDAHYTVNYSGGSKEFIVNQTMGGGTWIYLGTFPLKEGYNDALPVVSLSNHTDHGGHLVVTADAVKIGGGIGNIERSPRRSDVYYEPSTPDNITPVQVENEEEEEEVSEEGDDTEISEGDEESGDDEESDDEESDDEEDEDGLTDNQGETEQQTIQKPTPPAPPRGNAPVFSTSGLPRYLEGARYWMHWAGFPEYVYSPFHGTDDYKDDYTGRGHWVNYLAGGSRVLPDREGMNIPVDISVALHSDAGKRADDSIIGTLGIYYTKDGASYADGTPRSNSRMLTDLLMRQITGDVRRTYEPQWTRRSMWDRSYLEARVPEVPASLIELLSHQNFGDMQYGLDPNFRFLVSRAMYKAMARFVAERKGREVVIQPLPVKDFAITPSKGTGRYRLSWQPTDDPLEPTAKPDRYAVMERIEGQLGFHLLKETKSNHIEIEVKNDEIHSYRIIAINDGGQSFPSETLSLRYAPGDKTPVLIVNGFDRVSGPGHFTLPDGKAGFDSREDFGVPYIRDISFTGHQQEMRRNAGEAFGRSGSEYTDKIIAGNTFDFPAVHGESIANADHGFVSCSAGAVENGSVKLTDFKTVDLILGKQRATTVGKGYSGISYRAFPKTLQRALRGFIDKGGSLIVSGQYVASDLLDGVADDEDKAFAHDVLGVEIPDSVTRRALSGSVKSIPTDLRTDIKERTYKYSNTLNEEQYIVEHPDVLQPAQGSNGQIFLEFSDSGDGAGVIRENGKSRVVVMSIPFESITDPTLRDRLMQELLQ